MKSFSLHRGLAPLLVSMPHIGTQIPAGLHPAFVPRALGVEDTDWHLDSLYDFLPELGASVIKPVMSRYVIDLNRPPDDTPMYPGVANTELCPTRFFTNEPLYAEGQAPSAQERETRRQAYWLPYHSALAAELARIQSVHGFALLWDAHSIRAEMPWLFEGRLPDLNIGTHNGASADAAITQAVADVCAGQGVYSHVVNARFKGGYITRHYGDPAHGIHAIQMEKCRHVYMRDEAPFVFDAELAQPFVPHLRAMMQAALEAATRLHALRMAQFPLAPLR